MDEELFELCREVYKRTTWNETDKAFCHLHNRIGEYLGVDITDEPHDMIAPLYTSDYLLEKLPATIDSREHKGEAANLITRKELMDPDDPAQGEVYFAWYDVYHDEFGPADFGVHADTPLKALLKLVVAVSDAGVEL